VRNLPEIVGPRVTTVCHDAPLLRVARPTPKGIQQVIDIGTVAKVDFKAETLGDFSLIDELEKSGFIDSVYKEWILSVVGRNIRFSIEPHAIVWTP
jgi:hypothetical protein